jgi:hypothetical protein
VDAESTEGAEPPPRQRSQTGIGVLSGLIFILVLCGLCISGWCASVWIKSFAIMDAGDGGKVNVAESGFSDWLRSYVVLDEAVEIKFLHSRFPQFFIFADRHSSPEFMMRLGRKHYVDVLRLIILRFWWQSIRQNAYSAGLNNSASTILLICHRNMEVKNVSGSLSAIENVGRTKQPSSLAVDKSLNISSGGLCSIFGCNGIIISGLRSILRRFSLAIHTARLALQNSGLPNHDESLAFNSPHGSHSDADSNRSDNSQNPVRPCRGPKPVTALRKPIPPLIQLCFFGCGACAPCFGCWLCRKGGRGWRVRFSYALIFLGLGLMLRDNGLTDSKKQDASDKPCSQGGNTVLRKYPLTSINYWGTVIGIGSTQMANVLDHKMRNLPCRHLELDEIWGFTDDPRNPGRHMTVSHIHLVTSPVLAVRAAILQEYRNAEAES